MSSTDNSDSGMYKMMGFVILALTVFTLICMLMARIFGGLAADPTDTLMRNALIERIAPVGQIRTTAMAEAEGEAAAAVQTVAAAPMTGEAAYAAACAACHDAGVAGAPKIGDAAGWDARVGLGLDALVASAIAGKGAMPARGGSALSDEDITSAIKHMTGL